MLRLNVSTSSDKSLRRFEVQAAPRSTLQTFAAAPRFGDGCACCKTWGVLLFPGQLAWQLGGTRLTWRHFPGGWCRRSWSSSWRADGRKSSRCRPSSRLSASRDASWGASGCEGLPPAASPRYRPIRPERAPVCCRIPWAAVVPSVTYRCAYKHCRARWQQPFSCVHQVHSVSAAVTKYLMQASNQRPLLSPNI